MLLLWHLRLCLRGLHWLLIWLGCGRLLLVLILLVLRLLLIGRPGRRHTLRGGDVADRFTRNDHLHASILLASRSGRVACNWIVLAEALGGYIIEIYALSNQVIAHRHGTTFRKLLIVVRRTGAVGVALDLHFQIRIRKQDSRDLCQLLPSSRFEGVLVGVEQNVGHVDDEPASAVASLQDRVELLLQALA